MQADETAVNEAIAKLKASGVTKGPELEALNNQSKVIERVLDADMQSLEASN